MSKTAHAVELGAFLKARRAQIGPIEVGLGEDETRRRVPGLRREEVAALASISTDYYTRLEQGRIAATPSVLAAVARALRLDDDGCAYLYKLAGRSREGEPRRAEAQPRPYLKGLLAHLDDVPAMVADRILNVLAWNQPAASLLVDFALIPAHRRNFVRILFEHRDLRGRYADWEDVARETVAYLRMEAARDPGDPRLTALVDELSAGDPSFRRLWADRHVATKRRGTSTFVHPLAGTLELSWETLTSDADPDQHLIVFTPEPGSGSERRLRNLRAHVGTPGDGRRPA
jgi:transcriptional regulator with XRE-family HTH domain